LSIGFLLRGRKDEDALEAKSLDFSGQLLKRAEAENHPGRVGGIGERCHRTIPAFERITSSLSSGSMQCLGAFDSAKHARASDTLFIRLRSVHLAAPRTMAGFLPAVCYVRYMNNVHILHQF
jgi:hypothetical protein